jgi:hypothetical protein
MSAATSGRDLGRLITAMPVVIGGRMRCSGCRVVFAAYQEKSYQLPLMSLTI